MMASTAFSIGTKAFQAIATFATVHRLVQLWGASGYGLWVTLTAFALYISLFDMGVGYGVKNRISEAWGRGRIDEASESVRIGVSIYLVASLIALVCGAFLILLVAPFNQHVLPAAILWIACVVSFFLSYHGIVLQGLARFKTLALVNLVAPCAWFIALQSWPRGASMSLALGSTLYSCALVAQALVLAWVSRRTQRFRIAGWHRTTFEQVKPLLRTGAQFLALQLATFALNGTGTFLVYRALGGNETAQYDAANKVFSILTIAFSTLIAIAWTEISRTKAAGDAVRLAGIRRLLHSVAAAFIGAAIVICWFSPALTHALTGIAVPSSAAVAFAVFVSLQMLAFTSAVFLNAFERLRAQIIAALVSIPVFLGVAIALLSEGFGMPSIPIASSVAMLPSLGVCYFIARRLVAAPSSPTGATA